MGTLPDFRTRLVALVLAAVAAAVFSPVLGADFILLDDLTVVVRNENLRAGLSPEGLRWAFASSYSANWYPLTWVSHLAGYELFGLDPRGHHALNLLLHAVNTALLFLALRSMTGRLWASALAAALFGVHPLRAEVVGWVTARTDALSGLFWILALLAWAAHARRPSPARYGLALGAYACGLMAKPSVITLPVALLVLDWWPLGRLRAASVASVLREKLPFFALAAASAATTVLVQRAWGAMGHVEGLTVPVRIGSALLGYAVSLRRAVAPAGLAILYPHPGAGIGIARPLAALLLLAAVTLLAVRWRRRRPWLLAGWLWYLATLLPMSGLVQVGVQSTADRYTYLPQMLLAVAVAWFAAGAAARGGGTARGVGAALAVAALAALGWEAHAQAGRWRDDVAVFGRAVEVTRGNWLAHMNYGAALGARGDHAGAREQFLAALQVRPDYPRARENLRLAEEALAREAAAGAPRP